MGHRTSWVTGARVPRRIAEPKAPAHLCLSHLSRGSRALLVIAAALALCSTGSALALPWAVWDVTVALTRSEPIAGPLLRLGALALGVAAAQVGSGWLLARAGEDLLLRLRRRVIDHVLRLQLSAAQAQGAGDVTARMTSDAALVRAWAEAALVHIPVAALGTVATLTAMVCLNPALTLLTVGSFGVAGVPLVSVIARTRRAADARQAALADLGQQLFGYMTALTPVKAYRHEAMAAARLGRTADHLGTVSVTAARLQSLMGPLVGLGQQVALVAVAVVATQRIATDDLSSATFNAFFFLLLYLTSPVTVVVLGIGHLRAGRAARDRLDRLFALKTEPDEPQRGSVRRPNVVHGDAVSFQDVTFSHSGAVPTLRELSFTVPSTGLTALVGPSGAGKSTVFALMGRYVQADQGHIRILGQEIDTWPLTELRRRIAYVDQHASVLEGTIRDNLQLGQAHPVSEDHLWEALETVGLRGVVERLPRTIDAYLGRGRDLSGGQRQRLVLARALLSDADLFLLDEPTSQLDDAGEKRVMCALERLAATRTVVVATHRLSTLRHARNYVAITAPVSGDADSQAPHSIGSDVR
jgi:ABC-type multidrug transport system fused ATPase/permease subunit